ncbi:hypothetical protein [Psychrobacter sp. DAB_AL32B]|uniref:hypothetical protein n=1 Tax=Psychrobacter sp. DAB_AL32B TaxID=1028414 RepID=UPI000B7F0EB8|nr:hypothetical protein [Psychrobacter sp. DAB_AL32B]OXL21805.1 hypothetical protein CAN34_09125 [Psychrobacter sp. DAB_AL32B]
MNSITDQKFQPEPIKSTGSKYTIQDDTINNWKLNTQFKLYYLEDDFNVPCCCAFFLFDDEWNKESLRALKEQTGADLLIGIQTSDRFMTTDNVVDGMVCCEIEQVDRIVHQFQAMLSVHGSYIAMDLNDIVSFFNQCPYTQYDELKLYQSDDFIEQNEQEIENFTAKLPIKDVKNLLLYIHTINPASLDQSSKIINMVDRKMSNSDMVLYGMATSTLNDAYISVIYPKEPPQSK